MTPAATALAASCPVSVESPDGAAPNGPSPARARIERQMVMLDRLAEIGMEIAEACGREVRAAALADDPGEGAGPPPADAARSASSSPESPVRCG